LITEIQSRYKAFLANGNPNTRDVSTWIPASNSDINVLLLGGSGKEPIGACTPDFWGKKAQYDYQFFDE
jgi:hypothetical protein